MLAGIFSSTHLNLQAITRTGFACCVCFGACGVADRSDGYRMRVIRMASYLVGPDPGALQVPVCKQKD